MRLSLIDPTRRSLAVFSKLQHILGSNRYRARGIVRGTPADAPCVDFHRTADKAGEDCAMEVVDELVGDRLPCRIVRVPHYIYLKDRREHPQARFEVDRLACKV